MAASPFQKKLNQELADRRARNRRYSLRAFAASLGTDHSSLSKMLLGARRVPASRIRAWAAALGIGEEETLAYVAAEQVADAATIQQQERTRQWTAEAMAVSADQVHWQILRLSRAADFRADCRWIAERAGVGLDELNLALSRLLRLGLLAMNDAGRWQDLTGPSPLTEPELRELALARVRDRA